MPGGMVIVGSLPHRTMVLRLPRNTLFGQHSYSSHATVPNSCGLVSRDAMPTRPGVLEAERVRCETATRRQGFEIETAFPTTQVRISERTYDRLGAHACAFMLLSSNLLPRRRYDYRDERYQYKRPRRNQLKSCPATDRLEPVEPR